jgi:hypothetical protein
MVMDKKYIEDEGNVESLSDNSNLQRIDRCIKLYENGVKSKKNQERMQSMMVEPECTSRPKLVSKMKNSSIVEYISNSPGKQNQSLTVFDKLSK